MKRIALVLVVAAALLAPSAALASGVVLKVQRTAHLVAVRTARSGVVLVHTKAAARLHVGQLVSLHARALRNGTFAASSVTVLGRAHRTSFRGLVLRGNRSRLLVSAAGAVLTIQRGAHANSALEETPPPGSGVAVTVQIGDDGTLDEANVSTVSPTTPGGRIEGQLTIGAGSVTVTDDEMALVLTVPTGFDLSGFANGDEVLATFSQGADGSLSLTALSRDDAEHDDAAPTTAGQQPGAPGGAGGQGEDGGGSGQNAGGGQDGGGGQNAGSGEDGGGGQAGGGQGGDGGSDG